MCGRQELAALRRDPESRRVYKKGQTLSCKFASLQRPSSEELSCIHCCLRLVGVSYILQSEAEKCSVSSSREKENLFPEAAEASIAIPSPVMAFAVYGLVAADLGGLVLPHADSRLKASLTRRASCATAGAARGSLTQSQTSSSEPLPSLFSSSSSQHDSWLSVTREPALMSVSSLKATGLQEAPQSAPDKADGRHIGRLNVDGNAAVNGILSIPTTSAEAQTVGGQVSSEEYNQRMKRAMANPYEYHHHLGEPNRRMLFKVQGSRLRKVESPVPHERKEELALRILGWKP